MTDKELLELAAKAANVERLDFGKGEIKTYCPDGYTTVWDPLTDDGDALRLAVKLGLYIEIDRPNARASALPEDENMEFSRERFSGDPCASTRRAIVRAAAKIGKAMP